MRKLFFVAMLSLAHLTMGQVPALIPARKEPVERRQPNGERVTLLLQGDEWHHWSMTLDHYQILEDDKGYIRYAMEKRQKVVASKRLAHNETDRTRCEKRWLRRKGIKK